MTTTFSALPIIDLQALKLGETLPTNTSQATRLSEQIYDAFATTGFAYLTNAPLSFSHDDVFTLAREFFSLPDEIKMKLAKKTFQPTNSNTYRGYFPTQPLNASDNLKEGFEIGPSNDQPSPTNNGYPTSHVKFNLDEPNVWPDKNVFEHQDKLEQLYTELQSLSSTLLSLIAISLDKPTDFFAHYLTNSISTLRLLHYPATDNEDLDNRSSTSRDSINTHGSRDSTEINTNTKAQVRLACTPHTDSGILTLLHQDSTGGLEVLNAAKNWIPAPYIPGSIVVNIGDLMAEVSGGRFVATMHRVRAPPVTSPIQPDDLDYKAAETNNKSSNTGNGRFSVPFFFEPGENCIVTSVDNDGSEHGILYGQHVRLKMKGWVEFNTNNNTDDDVGNAQL